MKPGLINQLRIVLSNWTVIIYLGKTEIEMEESQYTWENTSNANVCSDLTCDNLEALSIEPFIISACYRPPSADDAFFESLEKLIASVDSEEKELVMIGDFNCNQLSENPDRGTTQLNQICEVYQMQQLIKYPTRITETKTLIDLIITNTPNRMSLLEWCMLEWAITA